MPVIKIERGVKGRPNRKMRKKAEYILAKPPEKRTPEQLLWMEAYEAADAEPPAAGGADDAEDLIGDEPPAETPADADDPAPPPPPPPKPPRGAAPPPPPAGPRVRVNANTSANAPRQYAIDMCTKAWLGILDKMSDDLREVGVAPMIDPRALEEPIRTTLDKYLPAQVEVTPEVIAAGGSSIILFQRWKNREEIAKVRGKVPVAETARPITVQAAPASHDDAGPPPEISIRRYVAPEPEIVAEPEYIPHRDDGPTLPPDGGRSYVMGPS